MKLYLYRFDHNDKNLFKGFAKFIKRFSNFIQNFLSVFLKNLKIRDKTTVIVEIPYWI